MPEQNNTLNKIKQKIKDSLGCLSLIILVILLLLIFGIYKACNRPPALEESVSVSEIETFAPAQTPDTAAFRTDQATLPQTSDTLAPASIDLGATPAPTAAPQDIVGLFGFDSDMLPTAAQEQIAQFAQQYLASKTDKPIIIEGFTCDLGPADYNLDLSRRRVLAAQTILTTHGISNDRIVLHPYGEAKFAQHLYPTRREYRRVNMFVNNH